MSVASSAESSVALEPETTTFVRSSPFSDATARSRSAICWSPSHGDTAFTVPLFDQFMQRIMPDDDWR